MTSTLNFQLLSLKLFGEDEISVCTRFSEQLPDDLEPLLDSSSLVVLSLFTELDCLFIPYSGTNPV